MSYIKIEFPCGYKFEANMNGWFDNFKMSGDVEECPLHGKNCPPKEGGKKK